MQAAQPPLWCTLQTRRSSSQLAAAQPVATPPQHKLSHGRYHSNRDEQDRPPHTKVLLTAGVQATQGGRVAYTGDFLHSRPHGVGKLISAATGESYEGEWQHGLMHGRGRYAWTNSESYDGLWREDKPYGLGCYVWADGDTAENMFASSRFSGCGVRWSSTKVYCGVWSHDQLVQQQPVQRSLLPADSKYLSSAVRAAGSDILLLPDGGYYSGQVRVTAQLIGPGHKQSDVAMYQPHGAGRRFSAAPATATADLPVVAAAASAGAAAHAAAERARWAERSDVDDEEHKSAPAAAASASGASASAFASASSAVHAGSTAVAAAHTGDGEELQQQRARKKRPRLAVLFPPFRFASEH